METEDLIARLAAGAAPVRRLKPVWLRVLLWLAVALPYVAVVIYAKLRMADAIGPFDDLRFIIEQAATLATGIAAAAAAFASTVPGFDRRVLLLPIAPLGIWLASVGYGCWQDWIRLGPDGLSVAIDWECLPSATIIGIIPSIAIVVMLRRGAPLAPRLTLGLAGVAVAAVANFGLQFFHYTDASIMVLAWHLGSVAALWALASLAGTALLGAREASITRA